MDRKQKVKSALDSLFSRPQKNSETSQEASRPPETAGAESIEAQASAPVKEPAPLEQPLEVLPTAEVVSVSSQSDEIEAVLADAEPTLPQAEVLDPAADPVVQAEAPAEDMADPVLLEAVQPAVAPAQAAVHEEVHAAVFKLAGELYAIGINMVESIIKMQAITPVPHTAAYIRGVTNLRGIVLPVFDLKTLLDLPGSEETRDHRIIVVRLHNEMVGLVVDEVSEVQRISGEFIDPVPPIFGSVDSTYVDGIARVEDRIIILLNLRKALGIV